MMQHDKHISLRLLVLITTPKLADKAIKMYREGALAVKYEINAEGTAPSEIMDMLGLGSSEKNILISFVPRKSASEILKKLKKELKLGTVNSGIAFTVPLTGANNFIFKMLEQLCGEELSVYDKEESALTEIKHAVIAAIVNRGFSGEVMDAAKEAGAGGGTLINSRRIENDEIAGIWGLSAQDEKEIVLIVTDAEHKLEIMRSISEKCGVRSEAKGLVLSLPIDEVIGFTDEE